MAAPKNNKYAAKPASERASLLFAVRIKPDEKAAWSRMAKKVGLRLGQWARARLNAAAKNAADSTESAFR